MSLADELEVLDRCLVEQAYANVIEDLLILSGRSDELHEKLEEFITRIGHFMPGYLALIERHEEAIQMISEVPSLKYGDERFGMTKIALGVIAAGLVLAEICRLESGGE